MSNLILILVHSQKHLCLHTININATLARSGFSICNEPRVLVFFAMRAELAWGASLALRARHFHY